MNVYNKHIKSFENYNNIQLTNKLYGQEIRRINDQQKYFKCTYKKIGYVL